jgi:hypothetical protein
MSRVVALAALAVVPMIAGGVRGLGARWHSWALSAAGGTAVAYVFVHLLPELAEAQYAVEGDGVLPFLERHVYLFALAGLVIALVNQRFALSHPADRAVNAIAVTAAGGALVGYAVGSSQDSAAQPVVLFVIAMGLHYLVVDHGIATRYALTYRRIGRFVVSGAILAGGIAGIVSTAPASALALALALIAGAVILETFRHEIPNVGSASLAAFGGAAALYSVLLLATAG